MPCSDREIERPVQHLQRSSMGPRPVPHQAIVLGLMGALGCLPGACTASPAQDDEMGHEDGVGGSSDSLHDPCPDANAEARPMTGGGVLIDDFDDQDAQHLGNGTSGFWFVQQDQTGEIVSPSPPDGKLDPPRPAVGLSSPGGLTRDGYALHFVGGGFSTWGASVSAAFSAVDHHWCGFDASSYSGVTFWVRGSVDFVGEATSSLRQELREKLIVQINERDTMPRDVGGTCDPQKGQCWDAFRARIAVTDCWKRISVPFHLIAQDGWGTSGGDLDTEELTLLGFQVEWDQTFDLWIDEVAFYTGEPPPPEERCLQDNEDGDGEGGGPP